MKSLTNQHSGIHRICKLFDANILNKSSKLPNYHGNYFTQDPIGWQATLIWKIRSWGKILDESMKANSTYNAHQICGQSFGLSMSYIKCRYLVNGMCSLSVFMKYVEYKIWFKLFLCDYLYNWTSSNLRNNL